MTAHDERSAFEARVPHDPAYWSALAERITRSADPVFAELRVGQAWWNPLDRFGPALSIGAIAAAAATFVALPAGGPAAASNDDARPETVANPTDLLQNAFITPSLPDVMTLMILGTEE
ncbi:MAG TPA: hypothetical protein VGA37_13605 [Gemmatimonadales bacterium]